MLVFLAGDKAPAVSVVGDAAARNKAARRLGRRGGPTITPPSTWPSSTSRRSTSWVICSIVENNFPGKPGGRIVEQDAAGKVALGDRRRQLAAGRPGDERQPRR